MAESVWTTRLRWFMIEDNCWPQAMKATRLYNIAATNIRSRSHQLTQHSKAQLDWDENLSLYKCIGWLDSTTTIDYYFHCEEHKKYLPVLAGDSVPVIALAVPVSGQCGSSLLSAAVGEKTGRYKEKGELRKLYSCSLAGGETGRDTGHWQPLRY